MLSGTWETPWYRTFDMSCHVTEPVWRQPIKADLSLSLTFQAKSHDPSQRILGLVSTRVTLAAQKTLLKTNMTNKPTNRSVTRSKPCEMYATFFVYFLPFCQSSYDLLTSKLTMTQITGQWLDNHHVLYKTSFQFEKIVANVGK